MCLLGFCEKMSSCGSREKDFLTYDGSAGNHACIDAFLSAEGKERGCLEQWPVRAVTVNKAMRFGLRAASFHDKLPLYHALFL